MKNPFKQAKALSDALRANGIDPEGPDVGAALAAKIAGGDTTALAEKAAKWDKFSAQAKESGLDAESIVANADGLTDQLDTHARALLKEHLADNAPLKTEHNEPKPPAPTGALGPKAVAEQYQKLADAGDLDGCQLLTEQYGSAFLAHLNLTGA